MIWTSVIYGVRVFSPVALLEGSGCWIPESDVSDGLCILSDGSDVDCGNWPRLPIPAGWRLRIDGYRIFVGSRTDLDTLAGRNRILSVVLPSVIRSRGGLVLRGAAVAFGSSVWLILGGSGVGKSATLAALCERGGAIVSDDAIVLAHGRSGRVCVNSGPPILKLSPQAGVGPPAAIDLGPLAPESGRRAWECGATYSDPHHAIRRLILLTNEHYKTGLHALRPFDMLGALNEVEWALWPGGEGISLGNRFAMLSDLIRNAGGVSLCRPVSESRSEKWVGLLFAGSEMR